MEALQTMGVDLATGKDNTVWTVWDNRTGERKLVGFLTEDQAAQLEAQSDVRVIGKLMDKTREPDIEAETV